VPLSLSTRGVGNVTVIRCSGRIVAGSETESLRLHVSGLLRDRKEFVLHLGDVVFIDSSGLGTIVRLLTNTRRSHGDLKLCNVPESIGKTLKLTNLIALFDTHESEEGAISAFYRRKGVPEQAAPVGGSVLCVHQNGDVLAYLREFLRRGGYDVQTSSNLHDSLILMRVTRPALLLVDPDLATAPGTQQAFDAACVGVPRVELSSEFSTLDAGEAASQLLKHIRARLHSQQPS
jgi:anti-sigma B factor antagonist